MHKEETALFRRRRAKNWDRYMKGLDTAHLQVGNRATERLHFLNIDEATLRYVAEAGQYVLPESKRVINGFYDNLLKDEHLANIIRKHSNESELSRTLETFLQQFFSGKVDEEYVQTRVKVGEVHSEINLSANYFIMGYNIIVQYISTILMEKLSRRPDKMINLMLAVQKLATFDQQLIVDVYYETTFKVFLHDVSGMLNNVTELDITQDLIESMEKQIMEAHSVTAATEQMSSSIQDVSDHSVRVAEGTRDAVESAENSQKVIDGALKDIEEVGQVYDIVMEDVNQLGNEIDNTHEVIDVIKEIAEQTNLLALNASIEAARAGEAGQGFAVVATEVRKLSEHTKEQIQQITVNMNTLQNVSRQVTGRIRETGESVEKSVSGSRQAGEELNKIIQTMQSINEETMQIAAMSEEQSSTVVEISERNAHMSELSEEVQKLAQETARIIYELSQEMDEYRLGFVESGLIYNSKDIIKVAITDHLLWKWRIFNMMLGFEEVSLNEVTSHTDCRLGTWYYGDLPSRITNLPAYKNLEEPHQRVHDCARHAVEQYQLDNIDEVKDAIVRLEDASKEVVALLHELEKTV